jgi:hypothetical protein
VHNPFTPAETAIGILVVTLVVEAFTLLLRFGLQVRSSTHTRAVARFTRGHRIHHSYVGVAVLLCSLLFDAGTLPRALCVMVGAGVALSDLVHHFLVLWPATGDPEFHLRYPAADDVMESTVAVTAKSIDVEYRAPRSYHAAASSSESATLYTMRTTLRS